MVLLFKPRHVDLISRGIKTQTRRIWKSRRAVPGATHQARLKLYGEPFAYLRILSSETERLGDITPEDAAAEGGYTVAQFKEAWKAIYGVWDPDQEVWVVEFELEARCLTWSS